MYLKSIELSGFKSFADRTELEFVPGITAVVGPNGSGKSNITDAIRWVLGEQSAKSLRGSKMEDIIFAGSDSRKPVNYSEVSITLNNMDRSLKVEYSEVTVTRRVYRSGDSEYFINKQPCRLKDITELFMDTGLGKEAYSIIGQGRIEEIISSKPEDRRGIFEEAAGIVKYKARKKEAQRKLDETEQNLLRIDDLIIELKDQIEPLEEQAKVAKQYKTYNEILLEKNIQVYVHEIEKVHQEWQEAENYKTQLSEQQVDVRSKVSQFDAVIEQKRWSVRQMEKEIEDLHQQLLQVSEEVEKTEGKREVLRERSKNQQQIKTQTMQTIKNLQMKKLEVSTQLQSQNQRLEEVNKEIEQISMRLLREQEALEQLLTNHYERVESLKEDYFDLLNQMASLRNEIRHIEASKQGLQIRIDKLQTERIQLEKSYSQVHEKKENSQRELENAQKQTEKIGQEYREHIKTQRNIMEQLESKQQEFQQSQQKLESLRSRQEVIVEMQADFAGFQYGVKEILKQREKGLIAGIHGAVAELLHVPKQYETAIEVVLGGALQFIVVDQEQTGRKAIDYLKEKKLGRATFLPLSVMKGKRVHSSEMKRIENIKGFVGIAVDLVQVDSQYQTIADYLLGQVIVANDLKTAGEIAHAIGFHYRIVTLDGDVVNAGGSMTGGSVQKKNTNLLSRQREIDELTFQIEELQKKVDHNQVRIEKLKLQDQSIKKTLEQLRSNGEQYRIQEQETKEKWNQYTYELKNIEERKNIIQQEIEMVSSENKQWVANEEQIRQNLEEKQTQENELKQKIEIAESVRQQDESTKEETNQQITQLKVEIARLQQQRDGLLHLVERQNTDYAEIINSIEENQQILINLESGLGNDQQSEDELINQIQQLRFDKEQLQKSLNDKRKNRVKILQQIESEEIESKEIRKKLKFIETELHQLEVRLNRLDVSLENLLSQLAQDYEMSYEWAKEHVQRVENIEQVKKEVKELKEKVQKLGDVNLGAIDEFERVSERYHFLSTQKEDLVEAKQTLYQVIDEMDQEMVKRFKENFDAVREQFQIVFVKLFGGGRADLVLTEPQNLLETGVEIVAQPPGKKLQNLALLSGGEKALTAITLLFAILQIKPVPFCVLDEVEAALDEANVARFANYLRGYSDETQFIVVTHRKGTMEEADVLYGVTMQESGVSRLVSVKLEEKAKEMQPA